MQMQNGVKNLQKLAEELQILCSYKYPKHQIIIKSKTDQKMPT